MLLDYKIVKKEDPSYPNNLKSIDFAPDTIYISGEVTKADEKAVAIIGSRSMTEYGKKIAWDFAATLASKGITIVSGIARGIDTVSHKAALYVGGRTMAVLGSGIDIIYPPENFQLAKAITQNGAIVTEYSPKTPPYRKNFLARNRIISGLSLATLVVEGRRISGTLSISNWALNQGREVFAVPWPIDSELSELPNYLIENGATPVQSPKDIVEYINKLKD